MSKYVDLILRCVPAVLDHGADCLLAFAFSGARFYTEDSVREG